MQGRIPLQDEWAELGKIDYFLDNLARAVERGEVPKDSYDRLAPRYLERRRELVDAIAAAAAPTARDPARRSHRVARPARGWRPVGEEFSAFGPSQPLAASTPSQHRPSKPVEWTTVLLFLGAFLVIVASAIFAVAVWDVLGVEAKLGFMGTLTVAFYAAGWWARERLGLKVGSVALTAVASAMLLLDGWIAIDGFNLEGPLPWAVLLLACSLVYWVTEVRTSGHYFGVIGAAAQVGWWWLLGAGLGWPVPQRLAGIAVVAVVWQLAAERGRDDESLGSLARVLLWAAPAAVVGAGIGALADLALIRSAGVSEVLAAAVIAACGMLVWSRTGFLGTSGRYLVAACLQVPLLVAAWTAFATDGRSWWVVAVLVGASVVFHSVAIVRAGASLAVAGLIAELSAAVFACRLLELDAETTTLVLSGLGALWAAAARMAENTLFAEDAPAGTLAVGVVAETSALLLLAGCSLAVPLASDGVALAGSALSQREALVAIGVAVAWFAAAAVRPGGLLQLGAVGYSFYAVASLMSWAFPGRTAAAYALGLVALAGVWLASAGRRSVQAPGDLTGVLRWWMRATVLLVAVAGVLFEHSVSTPGAAGTFEAAVLVCAAAVILLVDAAFSGCRTSAAAAGALLALGGWEIGGVAGSTNGHAAVGAALAAVSAVLASVLARRRWSEASLLALGSVATATLLVGVGGSHGHALAVALVLCAVAWALTGVLVGQIVVAPTAVLLVAAVVALLSATGASGWVTVGALGVAGFALTSFVVLPEFRRAGRLRLAGALAAASGVATHVFLVMLGRAGDSSGSEWWSIGEQGLVVSLLMLGANVLIVAAMLRLEPAWYAGFLSLLAALLTQMSLMSVDLIEFYTTPIALYVALMGYLAVALDRRRTYPVVLDVASVVIGLGVPLSRALAGPGHPDYAIHAAWTVGLSLCALGAGVGLRSRVYFFGGVGVLVAVAVRLSFGALVQYWWLVLGIIGIAMLAVALTWERQRLLVNETRERLHASFKGWR